MALVTILTACGARPAARSPEPPRDIGQLVSDGYAAARAGDASRAQRSFHAALAALTGSSPERGAGDVERLPSPSHKTVFCRTAAGVFIVDGQTGAPRAWFGSNGHVFPLSDTRVLVWGGPSLLVDATDGAILFRKEVDDVSLANNASVAAYLWRVQDATEVHVVDVGARTDVVVGVLPKPASGYVWKSREFVAGTRLLHVRSELASGLTLDHFARPIAEYVFDVTARRVLWSGQATTKDPALLIASADAREVAVASPSASKVELFDVTTSTRLGSSSACPDPNSLTFSASGKLLLVGDNNQVCILATPDLRLARRVRDIIPKPELAAGPRPHQDGPRDHQGDVRRRSRLSRQR